jgi:L-histidine N-alpha-methyltransferase
MVAFLGGTIGNLVPAERAAFLTALRAVLEPGETLLLGTGLVIDEATLVAAYDDAAGVTAEFNRNVLHVLNRELGATSTSTRSPTGRCGTPSTSGSRCGSWRGAR